MLLMTRAAVAQTSGVNLTPSISQQVVQPAGTGLSINILNNDFIAGQPFNSLTTIAAAFAAAGNSGTVIIPKTNSEAGTFSNPNNISYMDWRMGRIGTPTHNLSFAGNNLFFFNADNSPLTADACCGGERPAGVGNAAPMVHVHLYELGNANALPAYFMSEWAAGATGYQIGYDLATVADSGSMPQQVSGVVITADNSGWIIGSCTLTAGIDTCTTTTTIHPNIVAALPGTGVYVSGNTIANTGIATGVVTAATANSITFRNANQSASGGPISGGIIAPNHQAWGSELNIFNNNHDPGATTPTSGQNVYPFHGITSTSTGNFPVSEGFYAGGNQYAGFRSDSSTTGDFIAGTPLAGGPSVGTVGFIARPTRVATSRANYSSKTLQMTDSLWGGTSYSESSSLFYRKPVSNGRAATSVTELDTPTTNFQWSDGGQALFPSGSAALPTYSFAADATSGVYRNADGTVRYAAGGQDIASFGGGGATLYKDLLATTGVGAAAGMEHHRYTTTCTTSATPLSPCTTSALAWTVPSIDTNYTLVCTLERPTGLPVISSVTKGTSSFTLTIVNLSAAAATATADCIRMHD